MALNPKQDRFCREYVIDLNGTQAAIRAGYSKKTANEQAGRLLVNVSIQNRIKELQNKIELQVEKNGIDVVNELIKVGFANIQDFIGSDFEVNDISQLPKEKAAAISSIEVTTRSIGSEDSPIFERNVKFKLHDKISALEKLGKYFGIFEKDNDQRKLVIIPTIIQVGTPETKKRLENL